LNADAIDEMGPVDYLVIEWPDEQPTGEAAPLLIDLVDRGLIRVLDLALIAKGDDGSVARIEIEEASERVEALKELIGASSGLLGDDDLDEVGQALEPGTTAALFVYENAWAAPFASAIRRSGGQLVANGRIPVQQIVAALDAAEAND
jgi:Family of unknown function (DUF6325)